MFNVCIIIMQSLNIKEQKLLKLQITQTRHSLNILQTKCLSSRPDKMKKKSGNVHKIIGAHLHV